MWICTGNELAKFHGNILSISENIAKSIRGGLLFFDSHCIFIQRSNNERFLIRDFRLQYFVNKRKC